VEMREDEVVSDIDQMLAEALDRGASDIHVEPLPERLRIRFREDGVMVPYRDLPIGVSAAFTSRLKVLCQSDISERRRHQGGRFTTTVNGTELDMRASFYVTLHGQKTVLRLLNRARTLQPLEEIGMPRRTLERYREDALDCPSGVVLVTGPTGSGKTSTLYSSINHINNDELAIITAEDPVEYTIDGISQCSLNAEIDLTYEETLRHIVRQDPDVIVIGEIRDRFSAETAIQAALTGHKVITTFHTEDTIGGLVRLLNMNIEAFLISSTVVSVLAQRLVRRVCDHCAVPYEPTAVDHRRLGLDASHLEGAEMRIGRGCNHCRGSGYRGRIAIFELLVLMEKIRDAILAHATSHEIRRISREESGLVSLFEDGLVKAARGLTTLSELYRMLPRLDAPRPLPELRRLVGD
ncbi:MAG: type II/IV secretion system protein, partial [Myxococcales bacterium]|nr:type II/IV secretion system protein [Myxococcales bacterium]